MSSLADKELNRYYFLAKTLAYGFNIFHLAKVLATTNSEPG